MNKSNRAFGRYFGTLAEIQADKVAGVLEPGMGYQSNDAGVPAQLFFAASTTVLRPWLTEAIVQEIADAAVLIEKNRAEAAEVNLFQNIATEEQSRIQGDQDEAAARATAIGAVQTAMNAALQNAVNVLRDQRQGNTIFVDYAANDTATLASLLPTPLVEGTTPIMFLSTDVKNEATITGLPVGSAAGTGNVDYGDILKVTVTNGVVTSVVKENNILSAKFTSLDDSVTQLFARTTIEAIRSNLSAGAFMSYVAGVFGVKVSTAPGNNIGGHLSDGGLFLNVGSTTVPFTNGDGVASTGEVGATFTTLFGQVAAINANGAFGAHNGLSKTGSNVGLGGQLVAGGAFVDFNGEALRFDGGDFLNDANTFMPVYQTDADGYPTTRVPNVRRQIFIDVQGNINTIIPNA